MSKTYPRLSSKFVQHLDVPDYLQKWLYRGGSLTQQLTQLAQGHFYVLLKSEQYQRLTLQDSVWLAMPSHHVAWVRESELYGCQAVPWVKAKSIIPILSLQKQARQFKTLKQRPMGKLLFYRTQPMCERRVLYLPEGWTRQSCYTWHGCKLIVQETFLPEFELFLQQHGEKRL